MENTRKERVLSTEDGLNAALESLIKKYKAVGGCCFVVFSDKNGQGSSGVAMQFPDKMRPIIPSLFRSIAFDVEKQNLMAHILTKEFDSIRSEVVREETRRIS